LSFCPDKRSDLGAGLLKLLLEGGLLSFCSLVPVGLQARRCAQSVALLRGEQLNLRKRRNNQFVLLRVAELA
jgi:hypothetical protein